MPAVEAGDVLQGAASKAPVKPSAPADPCTVQDALKECSPASDAAVAPAPGVYHELQEAGLDKSSVPASVDVVVMPSSSVQDLGKNP